MVVEPGPLSSQHPHIIDRKEEGLCPGYGCSAYDLVIIIMIVQPSALWCVACGVNGDIKPPAPGNGWTLSHIHTPRKHVRIQASAETLRPLAALTSLRAECWYCIGAYAVACITCHRCTESSQVQHLTCSAVPFQHTHTAGLLRFLVISIYTLAACDISLASIYSEVSDDSLSRLVVRIGCHAPRLQYRWPAGVYPACAGAIRVRRAVYDILNETSKYWSQF